MDDQESDKDPAKSPYEDVYIEFEAEQYKVTSYNPDQIVMDNCMKEEDSCGSLVTKVGQIINEKGSPIFVVDGYSYNYDKKQLLWKCTEKVTKKCTAACTTDSQEGVASVCSSFYKHNHPPDHSVMHSAATATGTEEDDEGDTELITKLGEFSQNKLTVEGYSYMMGAHKDTWRCAAQGCLATCETEDLNGFALIVATKIKHNHPPDDCDQSSDEVETVSVSASVENVSVVSVENDKTSCDADQNFAGQRAEMMTSYKGARKLVISGYVYNLERPGGYNELKEALSWKCARSYSLKCNAICRTENKPNPLVLTVRHKHIHSPDFGVIQTFRESAQYEVRLEGSLGEIMTSLKAKQYLAASGYLYILDNPLQQSATDTEEPLVEWKCQKYYRLKCTATCKTEKTENTQRIVETLSKHNHPVDFASINEFRRRTTGIQKKLGNFFQNMEGDRILNVEGNTYFWQQCQGLWRCEQEIHGCEATCEAIDVNGCYAEIQSCTQHNHSNESTQHLELESTSPTVIDITDNEDVEPLNRGGVVVKRRGRGKASQHNSTDCSQSSSSSPPPPAAAQQRTFEFDEMLIGQRGERLANPKSNNTKLYAVAGYVYNLDRPGDYNTKKKTVCWRCEKRFKLNCPAICRTNNEDRPKVITAKHKHSHPPNEKAVEAYRLSDHRFTYVNLIGSTGEKFLSFKGTIMFAVKGYLYNLDRRCDFNDESATVVWRCYKTYQTKCKATCRTYNLDEPKIIKTVNKHNHPADPKQIEEMKESATVEVKRSRFD